MKNKEELITKNRVAKRMELEESNSVFSIYKLPIYQVSSAGEIIGKWSDVKEASAQTGVPESEIILKIAGVTNNRKKWTTDNEMLDVIKPFLFFAFNTKTEKDYVFSTLKDAVDETGLTSEEIMTLFFKPDPENDWVFICTDKNRY